VKKSRAAWTAQRGDKRSMRCKFKLPEDPKQFLSLLWLIISHWHWMRRPDHRRMLGRIFFRLFFESSK